LPEPSSDDKNLLPEEEGKFEVDEEILAEAEPESNHEEDSEYDEDEVKNMLK